MKAKKIIKCVTDIKINIPVQIAEPQPANRLRESERSPIRGPQDRNPNPKRLQ